MVPDYSDLLDIELELTAELGIVKMSLKDILGLEKSSVIDLEDLAGEPARLYIKNRCVGLGDIDVREKNLAIRVKHILDSNDVIETFREE